MSADTIDDLLAAEGQALALASALRRALAAVEADDDVGDEYGSALDAAHAAVAVWDSYCRPTCQYRATGVCEAEYHPDGCGCPCRDKPADAGAGSAEATAYPHGASARIAPLALHVPEGAWQNADHADHDRCGCVPARHRLVAEIAVNGTPMRLEAHLVVPGADPQRSFVDDESISLIHDAVAADGPWATIEIGGREYVLVATPAG